MPKQTIQQSQARGRWSKLEIGEMVVQTRLHLYNRDLPCGAKAIREYLATVYPMAPLPSKTAISEILRRQGLTKGRTGSYEE